jgi:predicted dehydrogenase
LKENAVTDTIRWGILGTGWIASEFAQGLAELPDAELAAVGSRAAGSANRFADRFQVPRRHASYQALAEDPDVDVIYVATPNPLHREHSLLCLESGKSVLCEKPFALNAGEAQQVIDLGREKGLFVMEAMQTMDAIRAQWGLSFPTE